MVFVLVLEFDDLIYAEHTSRHDKQTRDKGHSLMLFAITMYQNII